MKGPPKGGPFVVCVGAEKSTSTGRLSDQYWLPIVTSTPSHRDQYSSDRRPVLVEIPLSRGGQFAPAEEVRRRGEIGGFDVTYFMVYSYCLRREIW